LAWPGLAQLRALGQVRAGLEGLHIASACTYSALLEISWIPCGGRDQLNKGTKWLPPLDWARLAGNHLASRSVPLILRPPVVPPSLHSRTANFTSATDGESRQFELINDGGEQREALWKQRRGRLGLISGSASRSDPCSAGREVQRRGIRTQSTTLLPERWVSHRPDALLVRIHKTNIAACVCPRPVLRGCTAILLRMPANLTCFTPLLETFRWMVDLCRQSHQRRVRERFFQLECLRAMTPWLNLPLPLLFRTAQY
jgi:hypothetical protein